MKRIAFITDNLLSIGGVQRVLAVIAIALSEDNDVTIITLEHTPSPDYTLYGLDKSRVKIQHMGQKGKQSILQKAYSGIYKKMQMRGKWASELYTLSSFPKEAREHFAEVLNEGNYDTIIAVHGGLSVKLASIRNRLNARKVIGWMHNSFEAFFLNEKSYYPGQMHHFRHQLSKLDNFIVLCKADAEKYQQHMGLKADVIYNPLTLIPGKPSDGTQKVFLSIGRMTPLHKGFDILIDAFAEFAKTDDEWRLVIVGEGPEEQIRREQIRSYGLENRIIISPFTTDIQSVYQKAGIYVMASRWEGMPLVLVEALSHGLPIIAPTIPVAKEILPDKVATFFETGNTGALAACMSQNKLLEMKRIATIPYSKAFSIEKIKQKWEELV